MYFNGKTGTGYETIEPAIGKGGEGSVYRIKGKSNYVLKVFIDKNRTESRHRKLLAMIASSMPQSALQQVTWPIDVVYQNGQFVGYVMPAVSNNEDLNVMYSDKYNCTLSEKITIAMNLCSAINSVHNAGQVCGDLNPKNISVDPQHALVTLVDTDSYHITEVGSGRVYKCEVGLPEYLPREIQEKMKNGQTLANAPLPTFTKYTDLFALAVHIFALLMNGCHPYACAVDNNVNIAQLTNSQPSVAAPQPIDNICTGFFPFYTKKSGITTPMYSPEFDDLPKNIKNLFVRAFVDGHNNPQSRPDAVEWYNALSVMQKNLKNCSNNSRHMFSNHLNVCPWCTIESKMRGISSPQLKQKSLNTNQYYTNTKNNVQQTGAANTPNAGGNLSGGQNKSNIWKWIGVAIAVVIFISIIRSCSYSSSNGSNQSNNGNVVSTQVNQSKNNDSNSNNGSNVNGQPTSGGYSDSNNTNESVAELKSLTVSEENYDTMDIDGIFVGETLSISEEAVISYSGSIFEDGARDTYNFTAPRDGRYRFELADTISGTQFRMMMWNKYESNVMDEFYGSEYVNLDAGETYEIQIRQYSGFSNYTLNIYSQKAPVDITNITTVQDQVSFEDQKNVYYFTASRDGRYRFELTETNANTQFLMMMWDKYENNVMDEYYGSAYVNLNAGETYEIQVRQYSGIGSYTLHVYHQKESTDITGYNVIRDSVQYEDQKNVYYFTAPRDGRYGFELAETNASTQFRMMMWDKYENNVMDEYYGSAYVNLNAGETYELQIRQYSDIGSYKLIIGYQKETTDISSVDVVYDTITYDDQKNVYIFTPTQSRKYQFKIKDNNSNCTFRLMAWDKYENNIIDSYNHEGSYSLEANQTYEIQVRQYEGQGSYSLYIE